MAPIGVTGNARRSIAPSGRKKSASVRFTL